MQNNSESVNVEIKMDAKILFSYMISNSWLNRSGLLKWVVTVIALCLMIYYIILGNMGTSVFLLALILVMNLVLQPLTYFFSAQKQVIQNQNFKHPIKYSIDNSGVHVDQNAGKGTITWPMLFKVIETRKLFLFYLSSNQALIIPKSFMEDSDIKKAREVIINHKSEIKKVRIKRS